MSYTCHILHRASIGPISLLHLASEDLWPFLAQTCWGVAPFQDLSDMGVSRVLRVVDEGLDGVANIGLHVPKKENSLAVSLYM